MFLGSRRALFVAVYDSNRKGHAYVRGAFGPELIIGVSAHSFDGRERYANERDTSHYIELIEQDGSAEVMREPIESASEYVFLGLRMNEGIDLGKYQELFGIDFLSKFTSEIERLAGAELIETYGNRIRLTARGMLLSNEVFSTFI